jgi:hypothetical protein
MQEAEVGGLESKTSLRQKQKPLSEKKKRQNSKRGLGCGLSDRALA